ncbi:MAG: YbhB/YbcL family Raf kinase inhibitor-like protein [Flavobacteriales bacterium]|nr:YbhB/YbcL family Raf kinase inhibitor-like protein [Flavobacteriales bacterium]
MILAAFAATTQSFGQSFTLTSKDVGGQATMQQVFNGFGCTGANVSPELSWSNAPTGTKSFAVTMYDPDAPTGSGWWHWTVFDIPMAISNLASGAGDASKGLLPSGALQGLTDFGVAGYGGPCPPLGHGPHQYLITVHALDTETLGLAAMASAPMVGFAVNQHTLEKATIVFYYERK